MEIKDLKVGDIVKIVYKAGSQPNTIREIKFLKVENGKLYAKCMLMSSQKMFNVSKVELYDEIKHKNNVPYAIKEIKQYKDIKDVYLSNKKLFESLNLFAELTENSLCLYELYKNGNKKKYPLMILSYQEMSDYWDPYKGQKIIQKRQKPYLIYIKDLKKSDFKHFNAAANTFIDLIQNYKNIFKI